MPCLDSLALRSHGHLKSPWSTYSTFLMKSWVWFLIVLGVKHMWDSLKLNFQSHAGVCSKAKQTWREPPPQKKIQKGIWCLAPHRKEIGCLSKPLGFLHLPEVLSVLFQGYYFYATFGYWRAAIMNGVREFHPSFVALAQWQPTSTVVHPSCGTEIRGQMETFMGGHIQGTD